MRTLIFGIEPEIDVVVFYGETFAQGLSRRTGGYFIEPVFCFIDEFFFELIHI